MFLTDALLSIVYPQSCRICGDSVEQRRFGVACAACWKEIEICAAEGSVGLYKGALRESVLLLKRQPYLPRHLSELLVERARRPPFDTVTRIIPVPLHKTRLRMRGFNQAAIIGRELSRALGIMMDEKSLVRISSSEKYRAGLDAKGRQESVANAFVVRYPKLIENEQILLVDDVFTTGATVSSCSDALNKAGANSVLILTLARVIF